MNKTIATTLLAASLTITLSGCTFALQEPEAEPTAMASQAPPKTTEEPETDEPEVDPASTIDCAEGELITIDKDSAYVEYTGVCGDVEIIADNVWANFAEVGSVTVNADNVSLGFTGPARDITVDGANNMLFGNAMGSIVVSGTYNAVTATAATAIAVSGSDNTVSWASGPASGEDTGTDNSLAGPAE